MERNVMFGYIHGGSVRSEFLESVVAIMAGKESEVLGSVHGVTCGPLVAMARNLLVRDFLASDMEWLWMVDTDIVFKPDTLERLLACRRDVVGALYYIFRNTGKTASMFKTGEDHEFPEIEEWEYQPGELTRVDATGAGCLLVHRGVFERIMKDNDGQFCWFRETVVGNRDIGEDLSFCMRVTKANFPIYVHTGVQVAHVKSAILGAVT